jgi:hypothetical protein
MPINKLRQLSLILLATQYPAYAANSVVAGTVSRIQGAALANHRESSENLNKDGVVQGGDRIVTWRNARVLLRVQDGVLLTLGAETEFVICTDTLG